MNPVDDLSMTWAENQQRNVNQKSYDASRKNVHWPNESEYVDEYIRIDHRRLHPKARKTPSPEPPEAPQPTQTLPLEHPSHSKRHINVLAGGKPEWPYCSEYVDKYCEGEDCEIHGHGRGGAGGGRISADNLDVLTKRPRTPNTRYTELTEEQIRGIKGNPHAFFMCESNEENPPAYGPGREGGRHYKDRYAIGLTSEHLLRGQSMSQPYVWIDEKWQKVIPPPHNTARLGAALRWGPSRTGERTLRHLTAENINDYTMIDCQRRPPTNEPCKITFKYGRPNEGYYNQRNPGTTTWTGANLHIDRNKYRFGSTMQPRTIAECAQLRALEKEAKLANMPEWPNCSEYTDRFLLNSKTETHLNTLEDNKKYLSTSASKVGSRSCSLPATPNSHKVHFDMTGAEMSRSGSPQKYHSPPAQREALMA